MSRGVFGALKDAVLILDEVKRLAENIRRLVERVERLEGRMTELDKDRAVDAVRDEALVARVEAATRVAAAETHAALVERIARLEYALNPAPRDPSPGRLPKNEDD